MTPDWTNEADYPFDERTPLSVWAWEFLRRNPKYRRDFLELRQKVACMKKDFGSAWRLADRAKIEIPERLPEEGTNAWKLRCDEAGTKARTLNLEQAYAEQWGLRGTMGNPDAPWHSRIQFIPPSPYPRLIITESDVQDILTEHETLDGGAIIAVRAGVALIAIDLTAPPDRQFKTAKKLLADNITRLPPAAPTPGDRLRMDKWKRYLRTLDAEAAKAGTREIGKTLDPSARWEKVHPGSTVKGWLKEAHELRRSGYLGIAAGPK